jgi:hypothetical protein
MAVTARESSNGRSPGAAMIASTRAPSAARRTIAFSFSAHSPRSASAACAASMAALASSPAHETTSWRAAAVSAIASEKPALRRQRAGAACRSASGWPCRRRSPPPGRPRTRRPPPPRASAGRRRGRRRADQPAGPPPSASRRHSRAAPTPPVPSKPSARTSSGPDRLSVVEPEPQSLSGWRWIAPPAREPPSVTATTPGISISRSASSRTGPIEALARATDAQRPQYREAIASGAAAPRERHAGDDASARAVQRVRPRRAGFDGLEQLHPRGGAAPDPSGPVATETDGLLVRRSISGGRVVPSQRRFGPRPGRRWSAAGAVGAPRSVQPSGPTARSARARPGSSRGRRGRPPRAEGSIGHTRTGLRGRLGREARAGG